jgi:hypothetical protein
VTANNPIAELLAAPVDPGWTVEALAERVLGAIAALLSDDAQEQEVVLDADATTDRQSRRLLRALLACLAAKSAAEEAARPQRTGVDCRAVREPARNRARLVAPVEFTAGKPQRESGTTSRTD